MVYHWPRSELYSGTACQSRFQYYHVFPEAKLPSRGQVGSMPFYLGSKARSSQCDGAGKTIMHVLKALPTKAAAREDRNPRSA
eukprot:6204248-Pleurochrysis_carterae.AAC.2